MGQGRKCFAMASAGRVMWWGQEDSALLTGKSSPEPSHGWGTPLGRVSFPSVCPGLQVVGLSMEQMRECRLGGADGEVQMGQMQKAPACPSTEGQVKEEWPYNSLPFGKQSQAPLFPLWEIFIS